MRSTATAPFVVLVGLLGVSSRADADEHTWTASFDVIDTTSGKRTRAVLYLEDGFAIAKPAEGRGDIKVRVAGFDRLTLAGKKATFGFPASTKRAPLVVYDVVINGQLLLKDTALCDGGALEFVRSAARETCDEIVVAEAHRQGDWDPCAVAYQAQDRARCARVIPPLEVYAKRLAQLSSADGPDLTRAPP